MPLSTPGKRASIGNAANSAPTFSKGDEEIAHPSPENQKKYECATEHFDRLNEWLAETGSPMRYQCNVLTPKDYNKFFQQLRNSELVGFRSELDITLKKAAEMTT